MCFHVLVSNLFKGIVSFSLFLAAKKHKACNREGDPDSEDEGIDLTDGPVNVRVERCERYFYLQNYKSVRL